jgi:ATP-dependent helicase HepA
MSDFHRVLLGLLASARRIDRDQALLGALGVGAFAYVHQVDSVHRMVTGTACRWLLADEVGLGKTVQAIMVMRALAAQSPRPLAAALVVPDDLVGQWEEELLCRGHALALESGEQGAIAGNLVLRLCRPSRLLDGGKIVADRVDLLLVDEFTKLQVQVREDLITASRTIPNVIVMTATPALHDSRQRRELMQLLEPEADRIARAENRDILTVLAEREAAARARYAMELQESSKRRAIEEGHGLYRRLIRTARDDYPNALPKRVYQPIKLSPTDGDAERARATREYLEATRTSNLNIDRKALLQVSGRSPQSLRRRLSTLRRTTSDLQTAWQQITTCLRDEPGDAKLDALIDHLRELHAKHPDRRVVIVAEDDPTTDYLSEAIEKLTDMQVAKKRRNATAAEELEDQVALLKDALDDFISGQAKVLVAAEAAKEGHNLQFADEIIFFALPWSPPDIQQWIGRIDRLGTKGLPANRRIAITPIVVEGSIEHNILNVLEGTGVFLRSEVFDESEWEEISDAIGAVANGITGASWRDAERQAKTLGAAYGEWLDATTLPPSPRTALALKCESAFRSRCYAAPVLVAESDRWNWFQARERAAETMIKLAREDVLDVRNGRFGEQRFKTMWYKVKPGPDDLSIPELDPRGSWHLQAFITRRSDIECPPRPYVVHHGEKRSLRFFDHGCDLHDGVIEAFEAKAPVTSINSEFIIAYPAGHRALQWENQRLLLAVSEVDLRGAMSFYAQAVPEVGDTTSSRFEQEARASVTRIALAQFQADRRWMIDLAPPEMVFAALIEDGQDMIVADAAAALLEPFHDSHGVRQLARRRSMLSEPQLSAAKNAATRELTRLGGICVGQALAAVRRSVGTRLFAAQADADNLADAARAEVKAAELLEVPTEIKRAAIRGAELMLELTEAAWRARLARLEGIEAALKKVATLKQPKMFWVIPKSANAATP